MQKFSACCFKAFQIKKFSLQLVLFLSLIVCLQKLAQASNSPLRIAVASNFTPVLSQFIDEFEQQHNIKVDIISSASGVLYQQIVNGAPYDLFLSADSIRPQKLVDSSIALADSLTTYAKGELALWSRHQSFNAIEELTKLAATNKKFAIANPTIAPYGIAANEVLTKLELNTAFKQKLVLGLNVNQTFQQVISGAVYAGIIANSQLKLNNLEGLLIPKSLYANIEQKLVIIKRSKHKTLARDFIEFLLSDKIQNQIINLGYQPGKG